MLILGTVRSAAVACRPQVQFYRVFTVYTGRKQQQNKSSHSHSHSHSRGHTHSHSSSDNVLSTEKGGIRNPAIRITVIGLLANVGMAIGKGIGGVVFHSQALIADSVHAVSDLLSDFLTLATVSLGSKPPNEMFPNGYGKVETLGSLGVSALLMTAGVSMGWSSTISMLDQVGILEQLPNWLAHTHSHSHSHQATDINAAWLALGSIVIKEWLYHATMAVSRKTGSTVLVANAWHHRVDSLVSMVAVATIGGGYLWGVSWLDPLGGIIVSGMICRAGYATTRTAIMELADSNERISSEQTDDHWTQVTNILRDEHLALQVENVELMPSGPNYTAHISLCADGPLNRTLHEAVDLIISRLQDNNKRLRRVTVTIT